MDELERSREAFREATPACLASDWDSIVYGVVPDVPDAMTRLQNMIPDEVEQARALLRWYNAGASDPWWYTVPFPHQNAAQALISQLSFLSLATIIDDNRPEDMDAIARYALSTSSQLSLPDIQQNALLKFALQTKNEDKAYNYSFREMYPQALVKLISGLSFDRESIVLSPTGHDFGLSLLRHISMYPQALAKLFSELSLDRKSIILPSISYAFGLSLLQEIALREINKNIFVSPLSVALLLTLLYIASESETRQEIANLLDIRQLETMDLNLDILHLLISFMNKSGLILQIVNSVWVNQRYELNTDFVEICQVYHHAEIEAVDFANPNAANRINNWVRNATKGLISHIVSPNNLNANTAAVLINAIYFKAKWVHKFPKKDTTNELFYLIGGTSKNVPMMKQTQYFNYAAFDEFEAIVLPYKDSTFEMEIYLPHEDMSLDAKFLPKWMEKFHSLNIEDNPLRSEIEWSGRTIIRSPYGTLYLPRFRTDYDIELTEVLRLMGLEKPFDPDESDLSNLLLEKEIPVWISEIIHKTFLKVDEEGTEAAAITMGKIESGSFSLPPPEPVFEMIVNRPFFLLIRDSNSGTLFFIGQIMEPM